MYNEDELLMISGIQHFYYCKRQWGLIHNEQAWVDNIYTKKGEILHEKVNDPFIIETRGDKHLSRSMPLVSYKYGFYGISDAVEFIKDPCGMYIPSLSGTYNVYPIEYKAGKPKENLCDKVQVCVQAFCLEEMFKTKVERGYIYYGRTRHREPIDIDDNLRYQTEEIVKELHEAFELDIKFTPEYGPKCDHCSLFIICSPKMLGGYKSVKDYIHKKIVENRGV